MNVALNIINFGCNNKPGIKFIPELIINYFVIILM